MEKSVYQSEYWSTPFVIIGTFFYTIGGTLGDGIMTVPVELATTGFWAYLLIIIIPFLTEVLATILFIQIIQKVRKYLTGERGDGEDNNIHHRYTEIDESSGTEMVMHTETSHDIELENLEDEEEQQVYDEIKEDEEAETLFDPRQVEPETTVEISEDEEEVEPETTVEITEDNDEEEGGEEIATSEQDSLTEPFIPNGHVTQQQHDDITNEEGKHIIGRLSKGVESSLETTQYTPTTFMSRGVDLHTIARIYFNRYYCIFVDFVMIVKLLPALYVIGLCQTLISIFSDDEKQVMDLTEVTTPIFCIIGFVLVYFLGYLIDWVISYASCFKSAVVVLVVFFGLFVLTPFSSLDNIVYFSRVYFAQTFLIQGSILFIPQMFSKLRPTRRNIVYFNIAVVCGLVFSQVVSFIWCLCVWGVVPQNKEVSSPEDGETNLQNSLESGELSNVPFIILIREKYPRMAWVGYLVSLFTLVTFTVSFLIITAILKTVLDGFIKEIANFTATRYKGIKVRKKKKRRFQYAFTGCQIAGYVFLGLVNLLIAWGFSKNQFVLLEFSAWICVLVYLCFMAMLAVLDIIYNPFRNVRIWCEIPRWMFIFFTMILTGYYVLYSFWYCLYTLMKYIFIWSGSEIPF